MVVWMTTGEPTNDCVGMRECKQLKRLVDQGLQIKIETGTDKHKFFRHVRKVTCSRGGK